jgi:hypothetical protein
MELAERDIRFQQKSSATLFIVLKGTPSAVARWNATKRNALFTAHPHANCSADEHGTA